MEGKDFERRREGEDASRGGSDTVERRQSLELLISNFPQEYTYRGDGDLFSHPQNQIRLGSLQAVLDLDADLMANPQAGF